MMNKELAAVAFRVLTALGIKARRVDDNALTERLDELLEWLTIHTDACGIPQGDVSSLLLSGDLKVEMEIIAAMDGNPIPRGIRLCGMSRDPMCGLTCPPAEDTPPLNIKYDRVEVNHE
jgi:hypothetical protein